MNRTSFLSSLPFLQGNGDTLWPPVLWDGTVLWDREALIDQYHNLSIEPHKHHSAESAGPAYFCTGANQANFDPAMCEVQVARFKRNLGDYFKYAAFMYIEKQVYQVNLNWVRRVEVEDGSASRPPSLVIDFGICFFRFFSTQDRDTDRVKYLDKARLDLWGAVDSRHSRLPFPADGSPTSPLGPNSEPGQKQPLEARALLEDGEPGSISDARAKTKKRLESYESVFSDLESLRLLLKPKVSEKSSTVELKTTASQLLTSVAQNVADSYCTNAELKEAVGVHDRDLESNKEQMDNLLDMVWPRQKQNFQRQREQPDVPPVSRDVIDICLQEAERLLAAHKKALQSKYDLLHVPTRG